MRGGGETDSGDNERSDPVTWKFFRYLPNYKIVFVLSWCLVFWILFSCIAHGAQAGH